ncbi:hypothetical protein EJ357_06980 [Streptomyces cyaneochromogenes]|uniref:Matrixin family metalloprotease n=1 Tax=Streptomyces cyaneochromogenes TaxID=2496836 RepID=A0A3Q9EPR1_9ACTN|nr:hypothetical protein [Streptomyces cyaneochromogenes]AZQ33225.1 hypothetical protein EJ357_06980 [Streptomyces cyaneochromogenes]
MRSMRPARSLVITSLATACTIALFAAPAHGTYWSGGMPRADFSIRTYSYNPTWQGPLDNGIVNWNGTPTPAAIGKLSSSPNTLTATSYSDTWYGLFTSSGPRDSSRTFTIKLNSRTISRDATNFSNMVTRVFSHELGHGLSMADNPSTSSSSIMKYTAWNTLVKPTTYDIAEVNRIY